MTTPVEASLPPLEASRWPPRIPGEPLTRPGITARTVTEPNMMGQPERVTYVLWLDEEGLLRGVLKSGPCKFVIAVDPDYRRRGVGTALIDYATRRLHVDLHAQSYTPAGAALVNSYLQRAAV